METQHSYGEKAITVFNDENTLYFKAYDVGEALQAKHIYSLIKDFDQTEKKNFYCIFLTEKGMIKLAAKFRKQTQLIQWLYETSMSIKTQYLQNQIDVLQEFFDIEDGVDYYYIYHNTTSLNINVTKHLRKKNVDLRAMYPGGKMIYHATYQDYDRVFQILWHFLEAHHIMDDEYDVDGEHAKRCLDIAIALQKNDVETIKKLHDVLK